MKQPVLQIAYEFPPWARALDWGRLYANDDEKMALALEVCRRNIHAGTGGPFGAAIFSRATGALVAVGMNLVVARTNSTLHAEMVAFGSAQARMGTHSLAGPVEHELFASCEPCAMCLGATLWSGVRRLVCAGTGDDARAIGFDEGPVFDASWEYLKHRGIEVRREVRRDEARALLQGYARGGGAIYNG
jgi:tRNA(Arg) A34 adenosine deaminase TadA